MSYAGLLPVPLTTLRQPCREIGAAAVAAMRERVARPDLRRATSSCTGRSSQGVCGVSRGIDARLKSGPTEYRGRVTYYNCADGASSGSELRTRRSVRQTAWRGTNPSFASAYSR